MRQRVVQIGAPFKVPSYLMYPLVVPSIRFRTLVSNAYDAPLLPFIAGGCSSLCFVTGGCSSLCFVAGGCSLLRFIAGGCSSLFFIAGGCSSLRFVAGGCSLLRFVAGGAPNFALSLWDASRFALSLGDAPRFTSSLSIQWFHRIAPKFLHSIGPTEQHFYIWEPRCGYLHKVKRANGAINMHSKGSNKLLPKYWSTI